MDDAKPSECELATLAGIRAGLKAGADAIRGRYEEDLRQAEALMFKLMPESVVGKRDETPSQKLRRLTLEGYLEAISSVDPRTVVGGE